MNDIESKK